MRSRLGIWTGLSVWVAVVGMGLPAGVRGAEADSTAPPSDPGLALARHILENAKISKGICSVIGCESERLPIELARQLDLLVHVWIPDATLLSRIRSAADAEGLLGTRVIAEKGDPARLPYADNIVDVVFSSSLDKEGFSGLPLREILRALRPGGVTILAGAPCPIGPSGIRPWSRGSAMEEPTLKARSTTEPMSGCGSTSRSPTARTSGATGSMAPTTTRSPPTPSSRRRT